MNYKLLLLLSFCFSFSFSSELSNSLVEKKDITKSDQKTSLVSKPNQIYVEPLIEKKGDLKKAFDKIPYNEVELKMIKEIREKREQEGAILKSAPSIATIKPFASIKAEKLLDLRIYEEAKICIERANDEYEINLCDLELKNKVYILNQKRINNLEKEYIISQNK